MNDTELLREYSRNKSESAFAELVKRYIDFVHSTARRQVFDDQIAEEVTQTVFMLLARKANSLAGQCALGGWLYRTTCFIAARTVRSEQRRKKREQESMMMNVDHDGTNSEAAWQQLAPMLDEALNELGEQDRLALLIRFFQQKPMREVGESLGVSEAAAKMRVSRSIERLRALFAKRGIACSAVGLVLVLSEKSVSAAPVGLAGKVTANAVAGTAGTIGIFSLWQWTAQFSPMALAAMVTIMLALSTGGMRLYAHARHQQYVLAYGNQAVSQAADSPPARTNHAFKTGMRTASSFANPAIDVDDLLAKLRVALRRTNDTLVPGIEVVEIMKQFGPYGARAFAVLKEEATTLDNSAESTDPNQLAPHRAICAVGFLDKSVPGVTDYLWNIFKEAPKKTESASYLALVALSNRGLEPQDIPLLTERVLAETFDEHSDAFVKHQVVEWISQLIKTNGVAAQPYIPSVEALLDNSDARARFWAACALIEHEGTTNPKIFGEVITGLKNADAESLGWISLMLKEIGAPAKPVTPVLIAAARATDNENSRNWALGAVGKIDPEWRAELPEVDKVLTKDEQNQAFLDKVNSGTATVDDLLPRLKERENAHVAAEVLGNMGAAAEKGVPEMIRSLSLPDTDQNFTDILKAIHKIDPRAAMNPDDAMAVFKSALEKNGNEAVFNLFKTNGTWCAKSGANDFARQLALINPAVSDAYIAAVLKKNPEWNGIFTVQVTR